MPVDAVKVSVHFWHRSSIAPHAMVIVSEPAADWICSSVTTQALSASIPTAATPASGARRLFVIGTLLRIGRGGAGTGRPAACPNHPAARRGPGARLGNAR